MTMQTFNDLALADATELTAAFRAGTVSPVEVMEAVLDRIDSTNGDGQTGINAFTELFPEDAIAAARIAQDRYATARRTGAETPSLLGVAVAAKEKHFIKGKTFSEGHAPWADRTSVRDHPVIERLNAAGAIIHGRTTTPEFSATTYTHSGLWGVTRNPWNLAATPGGSSGGSGAALAAGMATLATASDIGGSTRIPSSFCGVVGYKAPYGRVPGVPPLSGDTYRGDGAMGRSVDDVALLHGVIAGRHPVDHASWGPHESPTIPGVPASLRATRIAVDLQAGNFPISDSVRANTLNLVELLRGAGADIEFVSLPWTPEQVISTALLHFGTLLTPALKQNLNENLEDTNTYVRWMIETSTNAARGKTVADSLREDAAIQAGLARTMSGFDVLITPTQGIDMLPAGHDQSRGIDIDDRHFEDTLHAHMTLPFNIANRCPVVALPSGLSGAGIPTGIQVVGHPLEEHTVFSVSRAIENLLPRMGYPAK